MKSNTPLTPKVKPSKLQLAKMLDIVREAGVENVSLRLSGNFGCEMKKRQDIMV